MRALITQTLGPGKTAITTTPRTIVMITPCQMALKFLLAALKEPILSRKQIITHFHQYVIHLCTSVPQLFTMPFLPHGLSLFSSVLYNNACMMQMDALHMMEKLFNQDNITRQLLSPRLNQPLSQPLKQPLSQPQNQARECLEKKIFYSDSYSTI